MLDEKCGSDILEDLLMDGTIIPVIYLKDV
jgi:hypothetical protein